MRNFGLLVAALMIITCAMDIVCSPIEHKKDSAHTEVNGRWKPITAHGDIAKAIEGGEYDNTRDRGKGNNVQ